jgi:hypothetical protein
VNSATVERHRGGTDAPAPSRFGATTCLQKSVTTQRFQFRIHPERRGDFLSLTSTMPKAERNDLAELQGSNQVARGLIPHSSCVVVTGRCGIPEYDPIDSVVKVNDYRIFAPAAGHIVLQCRRRGL